MKKIILLGIIIILLSYSCRNKIINNTKPTDDPSTYFPVQDFFREQIRKIDSLQFPITKYYQSSNKSDTTAISLEEFKLLATAFQSVNLPTDKYKETSFADQSIPSVTLTYTATDSTFLVQRLDVIIKPSSFKNDEVSSIYIEQKEEKNDTLFFKKLYWRANKSCMIITTMQAKNNSSKTEQTKLVWDFTD